ncbi:hypothetical protein J4T94_gp071 [Mycobacterium phage Krypton555]|uniref:Uncharacterized protein n=1 Tax=Mycobacterium phage Krypton555 TaxID=2015885 RepID=A0A222ZRW2_9CAUD|nr:hypothetical protein J4T94_gp071 [Mycobacterium phage Krypton555]ASR87145.1 hypothetical protein KRYPTON555_121 [Mycobacterium phage Krypton555]
MKIRVRFGIEGHTDSDDLTGERVMDYPPRVGDHIYKHGVGLEVEQVVWTFDVDSKCDVIVLLHAPDLDDARKFFQSGDDYV